MTEEWFVQTNFKIQDDLYNVRGRDTAHLMQNARELAQNIAELAQLKANLQGGGQLATIVQPQQQVQQQAPAIEPQQAQQQYAQPAQPAAGTNTGGQACDRCGAALFRTETRNGRPVLRCPSWSWNSQTKSDNGHSNVWL